MINLSIVVPTYKNWDEISLNFSHYSPYRDQLEILVVDNNETSVVPDVIPNWFRVIHEPRPGSYSARNTGIKNSSYKFIFFTDSDCYLPQPSIELLLNLSEGPLEVYSGPTIIKSQTENNIVFIHDKLFAFDFRRMKASGSAVTSNLLVPKCYFDCFGYFNADTFSGGDVEWTKNYTRHREIIYKDDLEVHHPARRTLKDLETKVRRVVGGQFKTLSLLRTIILVLAPPVVRFKKVIFSDVSPTSKISLIALLCRLKWVELYELLKLMMGRPRERM